MIIIRRANIVDIDAIVRLRVDLLCEVGNINSDDITPELASANQRYFAKAITEMELLL